LHFHLFVRVIAACFSTVKLVIDDTALLTGDAARRLGVSPERVRQLERAGVLVATKTVSGFRIYSAADVEKLRLQRAEARRRG
jgi:hypothetical protein